MKRSVTILGLIAPNLLALLTGCSGGQGPGAAAADTGVPGDASVADGESGISCTGESGAGLVTDCDHLLITPVTYGGPAPANCGPTHDQAGSGYLNCLRSFTIFNRGASTNLVHCLGTIPTAAACDEAPVMACLDAMFAAECVIPSIGPECEAIRTSCGTDPFDATACARELNVFSDAGLAEMNSCLRNSDPSVPCQSAYDSCLALARGI